MNVKVKLQNGQELVSLGVHSIPVTYQGITRESLTFLFPPETDLYSLLGLFTPENCDQIYLAEIDDGGQNGEIFLHEHYTIRLDSGIGLKDIAVNADIQDEQRVCWVTMAQSSLAERAILSQQEAIDCLLTASLEGGAAHV